MPSRAGAITSKGNDVAQKDDQADDAVHAGISIEAEAEVIRAGRVVKE